MIVHIINSNKYSGLGRCWTLCDIIHLLICIDVCDAIKNIVERLGTLITKEEIIKLESLYTQYVFDKTKIMNVLKSEKALVYLIFDMPEYCIGTGTRADIDELLILFNNIIMLLIELYISTTDEILEAYDISHSKGYWWYIDKKFITLDKKDYPNITYWIPDEWLLSDLARFFKSFAVYNTFLRIFNKIIEYENNVESEEMKMINDLCYNVFIAFEIAKYDYNLHTKPTALAFLSAKFGELLPILKKKIPYTLDIKQMFFDVYKIENLEISLTAGEIDFVIIFRKAWECSAKADTIFSVDALISFFSYVGVVNTFNFLIRHNFAKYNREREKKTILPEHVRIKDRLEYNLKNYWNFIQKWNVESIDFKKKTIAILLCMFIECVEDIVRIDECQSIIHRMIKVLAEKKENPRRRLRGFSFPASLCPAPFDPLGSKGRLRII